MRFLHGKGCYIDTNLHFDSFISVYKKMGDAMTKHKDADVLVNFASLRSAYESTVEALSFPQVSVLRRLKTVLSFSKFGSEKQLFSS